MSLSINTSSKTVSGSISAANVNQSTTASANSSVLISVDKDTQTIGVQIGTSVWTNSPGFLAQSSIDGVNWITEEYLVRIKSAVFSGNLRVSTIPSGETNAIFVIRNNGYKFVRISSSNAGFAGSATVTLNNSSAPFPLEVKAATYSASTIGISVAAVATDVFQLYGFTGKVVKVQRIEICGTQTTAAPINILLVKRITANTGGTSLNTTRVNHDSNNASASITQPLGYTANPTTGTGNGAIKSEKIFIGTTATATHSQKTVWEFGNGITQDIVLRSTNEGIVINLNGATIAGLILSVSVTWTEE